MIQEFSSKTPKYNIQVVFTINEYVRNTGPTIARQVTRK